MGDSIILDHILARSPLFFVALLVAVVEYHAPALEALEGKQILVGCAPSLPPFELAGLC